MKRRQRRTKGQKIYRFERINEIPQKFLSEKFSILPPVKQRKLERKMKAGSMLLWKKANAFTNNLNDFHTRVSRTFFGEEKFEGGSRKAKQESEKIIEGHCALADAIDAFIESYKEYIVNFNPKTRGSKDSPNPLTRIVHSAWELTNYCEDYINYLLKDIRLMEEQERK